MRLIGNPDNSHPEGCKLKWLFFGLLPAEPSQFVFPGIGKAGHLAEPKKGWQRILERARIADLRIHDLRRTIGSWQAKSGVSMAIIGKSLNHKNPNTTAIYARLDLDPIRSSSKYCNFSHAQSGGIEALSNC